MLFVPPSTAEEQPTRMARCQLDLSSPTGSPASHHSLPSSCLSPARLITLSPKMPHCSNRVLAARNASGRRWEGENGAMRDQDNDLQHPCTMPSLSWGECCPTSITTPQSISYTLVGGSSDIHLPSTKTPFHKGFSYDSSYSSGRALWLYIPTNTALTPHLKYDDQGKRLPIP